MQLNPMNKAFRNAPTKLMPQVVDVDYLDAAREMYPERDGWREVFDRFGDRYGFYSEAHGLKDDPGHHRSRGALNGIADAKSASPDLAAAEAEHDEAQATWTSCRSDFIKAAEAVAALTLGLSNAVTFRNRDGAFVMRLASGQEFTNDRQVDQARAKAQDEFKAAQKAMIAAEEPVVAARIKREKIAMQIYSDVVKGW